MIWTWNHYLDVVLAGVVGGVAALHAVSWLWAEPGDLARQRREIARKVRDRLNENGYGPLGHAIALEIGGRNYHDEGWEGGDR